MALATRQPRATLSEKRPVALGQALDEFLGQGRPRRLPDLLITRVTAAVADVFQRIRGKDHRILGDDGDVLAQVAQAQLADILPVDPYAATGNIVIAQQKLEQAGLAGAGGPDQRDALARCDIQADVIQSADLRAGRIREHDMLEADRRLLRDHRRLRRWRLADG